MNKVISELGPLGVEAKEGQLYQDPSDKEVFLLGKWSGGFNHAGSGYIAISLKTGYSWCGNWPTAKQAVSGLQLIANEALVRVENKA